jgi:5'-nucleotidase
MRILISNDDGVSAEGIARLRAVCLAHGEVTVVAPDGERSGCSHAFSGQEALTVREVDSGVFSVSGMPSDCTRLGLAKLCPDPDLVVTGINRGGNMGVDLFFSGTVGAAREAAMQGVPTLAFSQHLRGEPDWDRTERLAARALEELLRRPAPAGWFWNVNLPYEPAGDPCPLVECPPDPTALPLTFETLEDGRLRYEGRYNDREREVGSDVHHCFGGKITCSLIYGRPR